MSETMRILRKDLRRLRWPLILWLTILVARVALVGVGESVADDTFGRAQALRELAGVLATLETLMMALLIARLVHEEPLVGMDAFWLTRPYHRAALFAEKLAFVLIVLVLMPAAADVASMAWFHTGAVAQLTSVSSYLSSHLTWALAMMVIAVLTASLGGFTLAIAGVIAALATLAAIAISLAALNADEPSGYGSLVIDRDPTPGIVLLGVFVIAMLTVVAYQYRNRRRNVALPLALAALVAPVVAAAAWPWPFAHHPPATLGAWTNRAEVHVDHQSPLELGGITYYNPRKPSRLVVAHVPISGMPRELFVRMAGVRSKLAMPDGTVIRTERQDAARRGSHRGIVGGDMPVAALLGDARILNAPDYLYDAGAETWPPIVALSESEYARYRGQTGRLDATLEFQVMRADIHPLPLRPGAAIGDSTSRLEIIRAQPHLGGYSVDVRSWRAESLLSTYEPSEATFVLWNRARGSVLTQRGERFSGTVGIGVRGGGAVTAALPFALSRAGIGGISVGEGGGGAFTVRDRGLEFPLEAGAETVVDADWLAGAELVVFDTRYAGVLTKTLGVGALTIPGAPTQ